MRSETWHLRIEGTIGDRIREIAENEHRTIRQQVELALEEWLKAQAEQRKPHTTREA